MRFVMSVLTGILIFTASPSCPQTLGRIELATEPGGTSCNIVDAAPGLIQVHVLITETLAVDGVQFAAPKPACWLGATWIGDNILFTAFGDSQNNWGSGLSIGLGACLSSPVYLGTINYWTHGEALPCCWYPVVKTDDSRPDIPTPIMVACDERIHAITPGYAVINAQPECYCGQPVPVEKTTWGAVKAVYR